MDGPFASTEVKNICIDKATFTESSASRHQNGFPLRGLSAIAALVQKVMIDK